MVITVPKLRKKSAILGGKPRHALKQTDPIEDHKIAALQREGNYPKANAVPRALRVR